MKEERKTKYRTKKQWRKNEVITNKERTKKGTNKEIVNK